MLRLREFTPSDDVLNAIRSLRSDDDGMEPLERADETSEQLAAPEPARVGTPIMAKDAGQTPGRYLRARA